MITGIGVQCYFVLYTFPFMFSVLYQLIPQITELLLKKERKKKKNVNIVYIFFVDQVTHMKACKATKWNINCMLGNYQISPFIGSYAT